MNKIKNKILIDITTVLSSNDFHLSTYVNELLLRLIRDIEQDPDWDVVLAGFEDLHQNLIEIGFSQFAIDEIKKKVLFYTLESPYDADSTNQNKWNDIDAVIYEEEPDAFFSFDFKRGLPSTTGINHTHEGVKSIVAIENTYNLLKDNYPSWRFIRKAKEKLFINKMWNGVKNSDLVITNSKFSKSELKKHGLNEDKIKVRYPGELKFYTHIDEEKTKAEKEEIMSRFGLKDEAYLYYDGTLNQTADIENLIQLIKLISKSKSLPKKLLITGGSFYKGIGNEIKPKTNAAEEFLKIVEKNEAQSLIVTTGKIDNDELEILLQNAQAYLAYSSYKNFSYGVINAMRKKVPVIAKNNSSYPELTNEYCLLLSKKSVNSQFKEIKEYLNNDNIVKKNVRNAFSYSEKYNWDETAEEIWKDIKNLFELDIQ